MPTILIRHRVANYDEWRPHYDAHAKTRTSQGEQGARVFQTADNPNDVVIMFEWDSMENATRFIDSEDLREVMADAGVVGKPEITYLDEVSAKAPEKPPV